MIDPDRIIAEATRTAGVRIDRNDPILLSLVLNRLLLDDAAAALQEAIRKAQDETAAGTQQQIEAAKATAGRIITEVAGYAAERLRAAGDEAARVIGEAVDRKLVEAEILRRRQTRMLWLLACVAGMALVAQLITVLYI